jgi:hypothetical protein
MAKRTSRQQWEQTESDTGAIDANSGGGAGAGNPEPETIERTGGRVLRGNVQQYKKRLFPDRSGKGAGRSAKSGAARKSRPAAIGRGKSATGRPHSAGKTRKYRHHRML